MALVLVLGINHALKLPLSVGYDVRGHLEYIQIVARGRLPKPEEGWSTFQAPLYHIISAPFYLIFSWLLSEEASAKALRFIPVICGLLRVELIYRTVKAVLPDNKEAQILAIIIGAFMPMNIYHLAVLNNESLTSVLCALAVLFSIKVFLNPQHKVFPLYRLPRHLCGFRQRRKVVQASSDFILIGLHDSFRHCGVVLPPQPYVAL
jgi:hypothetical protein